MEDKVSNVEVLNVCLSLKILKNMNVVEYIHTYIGSYVHLFVGS